MKVRGEEGGEGQRGEGREATERERGEGGEGAGGGDGGGEGGEKSFPNPREEEKGEREARRGGREEGHARTLPAASRQSWLAFQIYPGRTKNEARRESVRGFGARPRKTQRSVFHPCYFSGDIPR